MRLFIIILITIAIGTLVGTVFGYYTIQNRSSVSFSGSSLEDSNFEGFQINGKECQAIDSDLTQFVFTITNMLEKKYGLSAEVHLVVDQESVDFHSVYFNIESGQTIEFNETLSGNYEDSVCTIIIKDVEEISD